MIGVDVHLVELVEGQIAAARKKQGGGDLQAMLTGDETWTVE